MSTRHGIITAQLAWMVVVLAWSDDREVLVTDQKELVGYIHTINMTSDNVKTVPAFKVIRPVAIDYDSVADRIYWSDVVSKEIRTSTRTGNDEETFLDLNSVAIPDGITIDSPNRLLFYTDSGNDVIASVSLLDPSKQTVLVNHDLKRPRAITVFHEKKLIIWTDWSTWASIKLCNYDGSGQNTLVSSDIQWPNGVTLDKKNEMVYWCDAGKDRIESIKLDGSQRRTVLHESETHYYSLFFFEDSLYLTDWSSKSVRQLALNGTEIDRVTAPRFNKLTGILILRVSRCRAGNYGDDCMGQCGHCAGGNTCDQRTGLCIDGCQQGYYGNCTQDLCRVNTTASLCNKPCECNLCRDHRTKCPVGCIGAWYNSTCTIATASTTTSSTMLSSTTISSTPSSTRQTETTVDGVSTEVHLSTASLGNESTYRMAEISSAAEAKAGQSEIWAVIAVLVCALVVVSIVYILHVRKLRRELNDLKKYDHLQHQSSASTDVTALSHDYSTVEGDQDGKEEEEEEENALPISKLCPDVLLRDPSPNLKRGECESSLVTFIDEEPCYVSLGSLNTNET